MKGDISVSKVPITYKWIIAIGMIVIGITVIFTALYVLKDHQYYRLIKWTGFILFWAGILLTPFAKESNESEMKKLDKSIE